MHVDLLLPDFGKPSLLPEASELHLLEAVALMTASPTCKLLPYTLSHCLLKYIIVLIGSSLYHIIYMDVW